MYVCANHSDDDQQVTAVTSSQWRAIYEIQYIVTTICIMIQHYHAVPNALAGYLNITITRTYEL